MTFDVMETIERNSESIDKLTSLVSEMNMKINKRETQYKLQVGIEAKTDGEKTIISLETRNRSFSRDRNQSYSRQRKLQ